MGKLLGAFAPERWALGPQEKELEELRGRLRKILSGAYDQGVLEQAAGGIDLVVGCCVASPAFGSGGDTVAQCTTGVEGDARCEQESHKPKPAVSKGCLLEDRGAHDRWMGLKTTHLAWNEAGVWYPTQRWAVRALFSVAGRSRCRQEDA